MVKENVKIKSSLPIIDKINMIKYLVSGYFINGEYTPYFKEINDIVAFFKYCVEGLEFESKEDENGNEVPESIYEVVINDEELMELWERRYYVLKSQLETIYTDVLDMVEFEKQRLIHSSTSIDDKVLEILQKESRNKDAELKALQEAERVQKAQAKQLEYANKISEMMTPEETVELNRLVLKKCEYDPNEMAQIIADRYLESNHHTDNVESVLAAKNDKIRELESYKKMYEARNVLANK